MDKLGNIQCPKCDGHQTQTVSEDSSSAVVNCTSCNHTWVASVVAD